MKERKAPPTFFFFRVTSHDPPVSAGFIETSMVIEAAAVGPMATTVVVGVVAGAAEAALDADVGQEVKDGHGRRGKYRQGN